MVIESRGRDDVLRSTSITVSPEPRSSLGGTLAFELDLPSGGAQTVELGFAVRDGDEPE